MTTTVAFIGAGSWGTTAAALAALTAPTVLWARRPEVAERGVARRRPDGHNAAGPSERRAARRFGG